MLWRVGKYYFCAPHFDAYLETNWDALDKYEIERLSEDEKDFDQYSNITATEPLCRVPRPHGEESDAAEDTQRCH